MRLVRRMSPLVLFALAAAGCGAAAPVPVKGVVTLDGKPLAAASVAFVPDGDGRYATGFTEADGGFAMSTNGRDGVVPGSYRVVVVKSEKGDEAVQSPKINSKEYFEMMKKSKNPGPRGLPGLYANQAKTPLRCKVPPEEQPVVFTLHSAAK